MSRVDDALSRDWFYEFDLPDGHSTTPNVPSDTATLHSARLQMVLSALRRTFGDDWSRLSALDLACHEAWFASHLARRGLTVEVVPPEGGNEQLESGKRAMVAGWVGE